MDAYQQMEMMISENDKLQTENQMLKRDYGQSSMFGQQKEQDLIKWQLDLREDLERIDHLLRGHVLKFTDDGGLIYVEPSDANLKPFNEYGVQLLMNVISFYLNRNTILSNYSEETINWKVKDFGDEVADLIYMKYAEMGMDTSDKRKMYPMIVRELVDTVHSAYLRAMNGGERQSLREGRHVHETIAPQMKGYYPGAGMQKSKGGILNPTNWFKT